MTCHRWFQLPRRSAQPSMRRVRPGSWRSTCSAQCLLGRLRGCAATRIHLGWPSSRNGLTCWGADPRDTRQSVSTAAKIITIILQEISRTSKSSDNPSSMAHQNKIIWQSQIRLKIPCGQHYEDKRDEKDSAIQRFQTPVAKNMYPMSICLHSLIKKIYCVCQ